MSATETSAVPRRALGRRFRVPGLIAAAAAAAAVLYYAVLAGLGPPDALAIPWWGLALAFFLAEAFPVHVHLRSEAHSLSLSELALVLGLYAAPPGELLLAMLLGTGLALLVVRRQRPLKLAFNLASFAVATSLALLVFHGFLTLGDAYGPAGWAGAAGVRDPRF